MHKPSIQARHLIEQAQIALQRNDRTAARRFAQQATQADPDCGEAWMMLAELSSGSARKSYLDQARRLALGKDRTTASAVSPREPPNHSGSVRKPFVFSPFSILAATILLSTFLITLLIWVSSPVRISVSAVDHSSPRQAGDLAKPSLTPTATTIPTLTPTTTATPDPTPTSTPVPTETPEVQFGLLPPLPGIPDNINEGERWIDIDLTHQRTYAFEGSTLIRIFIVSTGTQYHPTVTGQYRIYAKYRYTDMAGPGYYLPDVPYTMYFYKGYGIHGTYWHNNFGVPMSHGCVNMITADAAWLYQWASVGTLVNIHY